MGLTAVDSTTTRPGDRVLYFAIDNFSTIGLLERLFILSTESGTMAGAPSPTGGIASTPSLTSSPQSITPLQEAQLLAVLSGTMFVVLTSINMLAPLLLDLAGEFHTSLGTVGQLTAAAGIPWAILAPFMGVLSDRHGRRPVLAIGLVVLGVSTILSSQASDFSSLFIIRVIGGIGGATTGPNAMAAPADYFPPNRRGRAMGFVMAGMSLATVAGVPMVALGAAYMGWRMAFVVVGALLLLLAGAVWLFLPKDSRFTAGGSYLSGFAKALNDRTTSMMLLANLLERCSFLAVTTYLASFLMQSYSLGLDEVAPVLSVIAAGTLVGSLFGGRLADKGRQRVQYAVLLTVTALLAYPLFATVPGLVVTGAMAAGFGIADSLARPAWMWMITKVPEERRGATTGFAATSNQVGIVLGSTIGGMMVGLGSFAFVGMFAAATAVASAASCALSKSSGE